ncbi:hypothetical protein [Ideonella sp. A 288]|uniref:hypothetical protein n=1 Tax=Ideonella sp. A 288 TaxID=1962181 RepID=UPI0011861249|nr:hypothetical protein [Ideonella sp. A 288]
MKLHIVALSALFAAAGSYAADPGVERSFPVTPPNVLSAGNWQYQGAATFASNKPLTVGDMNWGADFVISKFKGTRVVLKYTGCIGLSSASTSMVGLMMPNPNYQGDLNSPTNPTNTSVGWELTVAARASSSPNFVVFRGNSTTGSLLSAVPVSASPPLTDAGYCASYRFVKSTAGVSLYINDILVFTGPSLDSSAGVAAYFQAFDKPSTFSSTKFVVKLDDDEEDDR